MIILFCFSTILQIIVKISLNGGKTKQNKKPICCYIIPIILGFFLPALLQETPHVSLPEVCPWALQTASRMAQPTKFLEFDTNLEQS